ncbi:NAD(P)-dependent oxidoreductase [Alcaligenes faecalis]|nr:NAD(P)-dependent oxidoreductase [Alcaligenes faecalis]
MGFFLGFPFCCCGLISEWAYCGHAGLFFPVSYRAQPGVSGCSLSFSLCISSMTTSPLLHRVALIGAGEVARFYGAALKSAGVQVPFILVRRESAPASELAHQLGAQLCLQADARWQDLDGVLSAVTGTQAEVVAKAVMPHLSSGTLYMDLCTAEPQAMESLDALAQQHGIELADLAIMGSVPSTGAQTALLAAGQGAGRAAAFWQAQGAPVRILPGKAGDAMRLKLLRSLMTKGLEALGIENLMLAERMGLRAELYEVLEDLNQRGLQDFMESCLRSHLVHGVRRRDEVLQVRRQLELAGIAPRVTNGVLDFFEHTAQTAPLQRSQAVGTQESLEVFLEEARLSSSRS